MDRRSRRAIASLLAAPTAARRIDWLRGVGPSLHSTQQLFYCYRAPF